MAGMIDTSFPKEGATKVSMTGEVTETQYYSLEDMQMGDNSGTTETDSVTDPKGSKGYSTINSRR